jgi:hypothetical protein
MKNYTCNNNKVSRKVNQMSGYQSSNQEQNLQFQKIQQKNTKKAEFQVKQDQNEFLERNSTNFVIILYFL